MRWGRTLGYSRGVLRQLLQRDLLVIHNLPHEAFPHVASTRQERLDLVTEVSTREVQRYQSQCLQQFREAELVDTPMPLTERLDIVAPTVVERQDPETWLSR